VPSNGQAWGLSLNGTAQVRVRRVAYPRTPDPLARMSRVEPVCGALDPSHLSHAQPTQPQAVVCGLTGTGGDRAADHYVGPDRAELIDVCRGEGPAEKALSAIKQVCMWPGLLVCVCVCRTSV
jgi:hypothetical protein